MPADALVIVADAHLGDAPPAVEEALLAFLDQVPEFGDALLINGDLFDFWFAYRRVIPRRGFHVAASLRALRRRVPITMVGGNHDRWGGDFWRQDLGIDFQPLRARFRAGGREVLAVHGDGLTEEHWSAALMHRVTRHPAAVALYRAVHPDAGIALVDWLSHRLGDTTRNPAVLERAAVRQRAWAERALLEDPALGLVTLGHTHIAANVEGAPGRLYVNPGAWMDGLRYAVVTAGGAELRQYGER
jgi:UDP-2,3-diacylglucosamine hydrolase